MAKQYKLKFKPTPISRLLKRPASPMKMVGYPHANSWYEYYELNYKFILAETARLEAERLEREAAAIQYSQGPFVDDYAAVSYAPVA